MLGRSARPPTPGPDGERARREELGGNDPAGPGRRGQDDHRAADYFRIGEIFVLAIVGILVILLVIRPLVARTLDALPSAIEAAKEHAMLADHSEDSMALAGPSGTGMSSAAIEEEDSMIDIDAIEGRVKASTLKKIGEIVERHPEETVGIIRQWMFSET